MAALTDWLEDHYDFQSIEWHFLSQQEGWTISWDCDAYQAIARTLEAATGYAPNPNMTKGFWIEKRIRGQMASVIAARRYIVRGSLDEELADMMPGCVCDAPSAPSIRGNVVFAGGLWTNPKFAGKGLGAHSYHVLLACAMLAWRPDYVLGVVEKKLLGLIRKEGFERIEGTVAWGEWEMYLVWMDMPQAYRILQRASAGSAREAASGTAAEPGRN